ncbi:hypothetical protein COT62_01035 [Candidatus Roizmanbacteria bacterium CG09_land_8_20_14_0_10_41_9]|uniref:Glycosyltransferase 2-like domain-containing protein n=1 Tax=Candidatus Roizmanbacteria bacterium CG09_land_8_20_14_0_10_41_9 TaxID=1974850 RepID=A0A2H0WVK0_9BACT|nr:MAG: hypothetical protein COT62_01035 [Candidatus Roizmanbacteria bacterium CG09_land_8_20_14_0_10_41_9]
MRPFFSIIIPTLNEEAFLPKLLANLEKQKERNFEVIVVDGQSEDGTRKVVQQFNSIPVRFLRVKKRNVSHQRNVGARASKGDYLVFLDADSGIAKTFTASLKKAIVKRKGLVFLPYLEPLEKQSQEKIFFPLANFLIELSQNTNKPFSSGGSIFFERNFFHLLGGFDERLALAEDHDLIQRASLWGVRVRSLPNIKVKFSLRRMKVEGKLSVFYKYVLATAHILLKGKIDKTLFTYKMGGSQYKHLEAGLSGKNSLDGQIKKIQHFFDRYLR